MANYTNEEMMFRVHGSENIVRWADLNNKKLSTEIKDRINWAAELATVYIDGRLKNTKYNGTFTSVPKIIEYLTTLFAGILLYDNRAVVPSDTTKDIMSRQRKAFIKGLREVLSGQMKLLHPTTGEELTNSSETAPTVVTSAIEATYVDNNCNSCLCNGCGCHTCVCKSLTLPSW